MRIYDKISQLNAIRFIDYVLSRLPFRTEVIQTDNGSDLGKQFHWRIINKGINHIYIIKPRSPRLDDKVK